MNPRSGCAVLALAVWLAGVPHALAHGTGERYDLPIPLGYYIVGAALVVALSFVITAIFVYGAPRASSYPRFDLLRLPGGQLLVQPVLIRLLQTIGLCALVAVIVTGLLGSQHPAKNLAPTIVWVFWWVGLGLFVALVANVWPALNPWRTLAVLIEAFWSRAQSPLRAYPNRLGEWPAVLALLAFVWIELVSPFASSPRALALMALAYTGATLLAMHVYGRDVWLMRGEAFTLVFLLLGRFAPIALLTTDRRACPVASGGIDHEACLTCFEAAAPGDRELVCRLPATGLLATEARSGAVVAFLLLLLSAVLFDGLLGTAFWRALEKWLTGDREGLLAATLGLAGIWAVFLVAYLGACAAMAAVADSRCPVGVLARRYALTLVPIAIGYDLAHNFSYLLVQGQSLAALASDPLGAGWNLFGSAGHEPNVGIVDARTTWRVAIAAIVVGHVVSVVLAHVIALQTEPTRRSALISLVPLTVLMVIYTAVSLSIIADPLVRFRVPDPSYSGLQWGRKFHLIPFSNKNRIFKIARAAAFGIKRTDPQVTGHVCFRGQSRRRPRVPDTSVSDPDLTWIDPHTTAPPGAKRLALWRRLAGAVVVGTNGDAIRPQTTETPHSKYSVKCHRGPKQHAPHHQDRSGEC
jgi:hypothetical protein